MANLRLHHLGLHLLKPDDYNFSLSKVLHFILNVGPLEGTFRKRMHNRLKLVAAQWSVWPTPVIFGLQSIIIVCENVRESPSQFAQKFHCIIPSSHVYFKVCVRCVHISVCWSWVLCFLFFSPTGTKVSSVTPMINCPLLYIHLWCLLFLLNSKNYQ
jgi:hypothetical protein